MRGLTLYIIFNCLLKSKKQNVFSHTAFIISLMRVGWLQHKMDGQKHFVLICFVLCIIFWSAASSSSTEFTWITLLCPFYYFANLNISKHFLLVEPWWGNAFSSNFSNLLWFMSGFILLKQMLLLYVSVWHLLHIGVNKINAIRIHVYLTGWLRCRQYSFPNIEDQQVSALKAFSCRFMFDKYCCLLLSNDVHLKA